MSELKPCPFCGGSADLVAYDGDEYMVQCSVCIGAAGQGYGSQSSSWTDATKDEAVSAWNTRAVPDVPELVTIGLVDFHALEFLKEAQHVDEIVSIGTLGYGVEVVTRNQAAEIIAAKDKEIEGVRSLLSSIDAGYAVYGKLLERAEAAEAENAQYEAQEPVGYIIKHPRFTDDFQTYELSEGDISNGYTQVPLYTSPATAPDLKAENERLREALEFYEDNANWESGDFQHSVDEHLGHNVLTLNMPNAVNDQGKIARAALKVEASHDKG